MAVVANMCRTVLAGHCMRLQPCKPLSCTATLLCMLRHRDLSPLNCAVPQSSIIRLCMRHASLGHERETSEMHSPGWAGLSHEEVTGYLRMARVHNTGPALALVLLGAWAGAGHSLSILLQNFGRVWAMAAISAGVSCASMVINDYFDWRSGADGMNAPHKPLPSGMVKPDGAVLLAGGLYVAALMLACAMEQPAVRAIVAFSTGATLLYTPVFKRVAMIKNALVATVVSLAILSGALAAGAGMDMLFRLAHPCTFAFCAIMFREVLMDCADVKGDSATGVRTLPVLLGPAPALIAATAVVQAVAATSVAKLLASSSPLAGAADIVFSPPLAAVAAAASSTGLDAAVSHMGGLITAADVGPVLCLPMSSQLVFAALVLLSMAHLLTQVHGVLQARFDPAVLSQAVDGCIKPIGLAMIMLAAMA